MNARTAALLCSWLAAVACQGEITQRELAASAPEGETAPAPGEASSAAPAGPLRSAGDAFGRGAVDDDPGGTPAAEPTARGDGGAAVPPAQPEEIVSAEQLLDYARYLAPVLVGRVLAEAEEQSLAEQGMAALGPLLDAWGREPGFAHSARTMMEMRLAASGQRDGIDYGLPGYLVQHVVAGDRPWSEVLTSDTCYDAADEPIACDTGAPYTAGVLTTRGFLAANEGRFNLRRSITTMATFACSAYPLPDTLQPRIEKARLITMFQAETAEQQMEAAAAGGFGNGFECYVCHGQFSLHAQLFVRFDRSGAWREDANGQQNPDAQLGESFNGTMRSHMIDPGEAASEASSIFGSDVTDLSQAARAIAAHPVFLNCAARNLLDHGLRLDPTKSVDGKLLSAIAAAARQSSADPTLRELMVAAFSHPDVVRDAVAGLSADPAVPEDEP
jgi:hypothetical protein